MTHRGWRMNCPISHFCLNNFSCGPGHLINAQTVCGWHGSRHRRDRLVRKVGCVNWNFPPLRPAKTTRYDPVRCVFLAAVALVMVLLAGCASMIASAGSDLASNLNVAMMNQDDPEIVRDGAPAYLLMLDGFVAGSPQNQAILGAAAELYAAYGVLFVDDPERARRLTSRARSYGQRTLCAANQQACDIWALPYQDFVLRLERLREKDAGALYTFALSWIAYIRAHSDDFSALARLPQVEASLVAVQQLDAGYKETEVEHFLGIMKTIRPPALGGDFDSGLAHFRRALELSVGQDLSIKVDYALYYARPLYDRELHDRLLNEVIDAEPVRQGYTLFNTLAQTQARQLLDSADEFF